MKFSQKHKVLIVDDSDFQRNLLSRLCTDVGYQPSVAENGQAALSALSIQDYDLIITDLEMPKLDGPQLLREMGQLNIKTPIILVSGHPEAVLNTSRALGTEAGLNIKAVFQKPYILQDVVALLKNAQLVKPTYQPKRDLTPPWYYLSPEDVIEGANTGMIESFYQPQVCRKKGQLIGFECLARWRLPGGNFLGPDAFIPTAEKNGLMRLVTNAMFDAAFKDLSAWNKEGRELPISLNISTDNLKDLKFPEMLESHINTYNIKPSSIVLELTESKIMEELKNCLEVMARIRMMGIGLSIDDFGTGYSSLNRLQYCPFTELKLDQSYVAAALNNKRSQAVLKTSIQLAQNLSLTCIAEGVETEEIANLLIDLGCTSHQGFLYAQPMPGSAVLPWIKSLFLDASDPKSNKNIFAVSEPDERTPKPNLEHITQMKPH